MTSAHLLAAILVGVATSANAQSTMKDGPHAATASTNVAAPLTEAVVLKVDKPASELTLKHDDLPSIGMGAMTMAFGVSDPRMLESVKAGDKVRFAADIVGGKPIVMKMELDR